MARLFGAERRGADFRSRVENGGGLTDFDTPDAGVECKLLKKPSWSDIEKAITQVEQAVARQGSGRLAVAILKRNGQQDRNAIVAFRLGTLLDRLAGGEPPA